VARLAGLEPATLGLEGRCSIQLSYKRNFGRGRGIRTPDILLPKQTRYQTALYPGQIVLLQRKRQHPIFHIVADFFGLVKLNRCVSAILIMARKPSFRHGLSDSSAMDGNGSVAHVFD
jgi:hypothetical protein